MRIGLKASSVSDCKGAEAYVKLYGINYAIRWGKDMPKSKTNKIIQVPLED
jgi:hypothetical protein